MGLTHPIALSASKKSPQTIMENMRETPALSPVFEGRLYLRSDNKQWQLRLFRFDGTTLTCLSTRKVKLPPGTRLDPSVLDLSELVMNRSPTASVTSPLLATPANKSRTKPGAEMARYYQLPKWTVNVADISAISLLKNNKRRNPFMNQNLSFCIRTYDGRCYVLKAQKEKDLERWLFILTKMWDFATALRSHFNPEPQQNIRGSLATNLQQNDDNIPLAQTISPKKLAIVTSQQEQSPTQNGNPSTPLSTVRKLVPPLPRENYGGLVRNSPTDDYEQQYEMPHLSDDKVNWIDAWRNSLAELVASDPHVKLAPPVIEPIKDDDTMSISSEMTSITTRARLKAEETTAETKPTAYPNTSHLRRRITAGSRHSTRKPTVSRRKASAAARLNIVGPAPEINLVEKEARVDPPPSNLQRKRSTDVKNWIESDRRPAYNRPVRSASIRKPSFKRADYVRPVSTPEIYSLNFFQNTSPSDETYSPKETNVTWPTSNADDNGLKYHSSVRGKAIQLVQPSEKSKATIVKEDADSDHVRSSSRSPTKRSSSPSPQSTSNRIQHHHSSSSLRSDQIASTSPLTNLMLNNAQAKKHSDMSSLDISSTDQRRRYSSVANAEDKAPSFSETQQMMWQKHYQIQQQQQQHHRQAGAIAAYPYPMTYGYGNMPSLVSPAIPPVAVQHSLMSTFPRSFRPDPTTDDKYSRTSDTPVINKRSSSFYHHSSEGKSYNDTSKLSDDLARLRVRPKSSVAGSDVSSKSKRPESWMGTKTPHYDLGDTNRKSVSSFNKLLDQRPVIRQQNHS
ncbi:hypothetical protein BGW37DRAFT_539097 [Umbelopsis sp. PMI_123]|nr:hypothetical protein BGW37DRAFT_539097 [Umbelopsis sp. PMI_123]